MENKTQKKEEALRLALIEVVNMKCDMQLAENWDKNDPEYLAVKNAAIVLNYMLRKDK